MLPDRVSNPTDELAEIFDPTWKNRKTIVCIYPKAHFSTCILKNLYNGSGLAIQSYFTSAPDKKGLQG